MDIYVARHPIFDRHRHVVGYDLSLRAGRLQGVGTTGPAANDPRVLDAAIQGLGLDTLVGPSPAMVTVTPAFVKADLWAALPAGRIVLKVHHDPAMADLDDLVAACDRAKAAGHRIAVVTSAEAPAPEALLALADTICIDYGNAEAAERLALAKAHAQRGAALLAERVINHEQFHAAIGLGFTQFQGYFFCEAEVVSGKDMTTTSHSMARLIAELNRPELDLDAIETLIKHDVALSVKLLRYLQSAGLGWRHEVASVGQGLRVLGHRAVRKWASLTAYSLLPSDKPRALMTTSLVRAQLCEELGRGRMGEEQRSELFLAGLLSTLEALLDRPMAVILADLPLAPDVNATLLGQRTPLSDYYALAIAYDQGQWDRVDALTARLALDPSALPDAYHRTIEWVGQLAAA